MSARDHRSRESYPVIRRDGRTISIWAGADYTCFQSNHRLRVPAEVIVMWKHLRRPRYEAIAYCRDCAHKRDEYMHIVGIPPKKSLS